MSKKVKPKIGRRYRKGEYDGKTVLWYDRERTFLFLPWTFTWYILTDDTLYRVSRSKMLIKKDTDKINLYNIQHTDAGATYFGLPYGSVYLLSTNMSNTNADGKRADDSVLFVSQKNKSKIAEAKKEFDEAEKLFKKQSSLNLSKKELRVAKRKFKSATKEYEKICNKYNRSLRLVKNPNEVADLIMQYAKADLRRYRGSIIQSSVSHPDAPDFDPHHSDDAFLEDVKDIPNDDNGGYDGYD